MRPKPPQSAIKPKAKLGKYRIERKLGEGGFAAVYRALDTIEGIRVALKIPYPHLVTDETLDDFRREVRLAAQLKHPNILPLKNAEFINDHFVVAFPLGDRTLADRLQSRLSLATALNFAGQMLDAVAYAHQHHVIHCDIKPENLILFPQNELLLTDFGIAKVALKTIRASGSGTIGYVAPEQAVGRPSYRSDVFSLGLILYRMLAGHLPEWPYEWPPPGYQRIRRLHADLVELMRRAIAIDPRRRFRDAGHMLAALRRVKPKALAYRAKGGGGHGVTKKASDWRTVRRRQFLQQFGRRLDTRHPCARCQGPVSEAMHFCPWCGASRSLHRAETPFPQHCPRCNRGLKLDWKYCPWCFGPGFDVPTTRSYSDVRYAGRCSNPACSRRLLMPFMRYCPWCRRKVQRSWKIEGSSDRCSSCHWGVVRAFWTHCPWCGNSL
jgi:serine/threonine-protein kinase